MYLTLVPHRIIGAFLVFQRREFANILIPMSLCYTIVCAFHVFRIYLFPRDYAILTQSFALSMYSEFTKISCMCCNYRIVRAFSVFLWRASCRESFLLSGLHGDLRRIEKRRHATALHPADHAMPRARF